MDNRTVKKSHINCKMSWVWEASSLKVFGCFCYPLIPSITRNKLQPSSTSCVFLGYPLNHRGYKCYESSNLKFWFFEYQRHLFLTRTHPYCLSQKLLRKFKNQWKTGGKQFYGLIIDQKKLTKVFLIPRQNKD
jgi:hypothetical protein